MIKPINGHVLIEPAKHEGFVQQAQQTYQEIGVVVDGGETPAEAGQTVYFDAWLAKKYPKEGSLTEYYWLVKYTDIVAYAQPLSE